MKYVPPSLSIIGPDGVAMLILANLAIAATGGLALALWFFKVYRVAKKAPSTTSHGGCKLVLGERLHESTPSVHFQRRLARALALKEIRQILIVGGPPNSLISEARAGKDWLVAQGAEPQDIYIEENSRNTLENLIEARRVIQKNSFGHVILISSRYHLARCATIATGLGISFNVCASEELLSMDYYNFSRMISEAYFMNWYFVGKTWATLTSNRKMLARLH